MSPKWNDQVKAGLLHSLFDFAYYGAMDNLYYNILYHTIYSICSSLLRFHHFWHCCTNWIKKKIFFPTVSWTRNEHPNIRNYLFKRSVGFLYLKSLLLCSCFLLIITFFMINFINWISASQPILNFIFILYFLFH